MRRLGLGFLDQCDWMGDRLLTRSARNDDQDSDCIEVAVIQRHDVGDLDLPHLHQVVDQEVSGAMEGVMICGSIAREATRGDRHLARCTGQGGRGLPPPVSMPGLAATTVDSSSTDTGPLEDESIPPCPRRPATGSLAVSELPPDVPAPATRCPA